MSRKQKRMGPVGCFGQIENIKRQSLVYYFTSLTLECFPKTLYNVVQMLLNQYTGAKIVVFSAPAKQSMKNTAEEALRLEAQSLH